MKRQVSVILSALVLIFTIFPVLLYAQDEGITTIILVRHAEKENDGTNDPGLTAEGLERAEELSYIMKNIKLDAIFHTQYKRTRLTVEPTSKIKSLESQVITSLKPADLKSFTENMLVDYKGKSVLIASHTNIVPALIKLIKGETVNFRSLKFIHGDVYDDLFIVYFTDRENAVTLNLKYGKRTEIH